ncbi:endothelin-converting enzyme 1-like, partial [Centruroides sculpturatus]|uniref:endothelin-converting enzyme 1-like n=1 Tax=Centruroides sculpturatus TaxID=218467 RepID=UPI000C6E1A2D
FTDTSNVSRKEICSNHICKYRAGSILSNMDFTVDPCKNFYEFACGSNQKYENIYDDQIRVLYNLRNYMIYLGKEQLEKPDEESDPSFVKKVKKYYESCLTKPTVLKEVVQTFLLEMNLDVWPQSPNDNSESTIEDAAAAAILYKGSGLLFRFIANLNDPKITLDIGITTVIPDVLSNISEKKFIKLKEQYSNLINYVFDKLGLSSEDSAKYVEEMITFETSLTEIQKTNRNLEFNSINSTISELQSECPQIKWKQLLKRVYEYIYHPEDYTEELLIKISSKNYLDDLCELVGNTTNKRIIYNLLLWNVFIRYLPRFDYFFRQLLIDSKRFLRFYESFYQPLSGIHKLIWKSCIQDMELYIQKVLSYMMIKSMNPEKDIKEVSEYTDRIYEEMTQLFSEDDWMDDYSKNITKVKLNNIKPFIGYEKESLEEDFLNLIFDNINITDNYIWNILHVENLKFLNYMYNPNITSVLRKVYIYEPIGAHAYYSERNFGGRLEIEINITDNYIWNILHVENLKFLNYMYNPNITSVLRKVYIYEPIGAHAYYSERNFGGRLAISLGIMNPPYYHYDSPKYLNFAGIASVIGHEFSHGFDILDVINERTENSTNKNKNEIKWPEEFLQEYKRRKYCLIHQYSQLPLEGNMTVDGNATIRDNIADNNGLTVSFRAYRKYLKQHGEEPYLPGLDFSNKQMYFIGYAQMWCEIVESLKKTFEFDAHSPGKYRLLIPLMNSPEFSEVFNCPLNSYMNPEHKCRMWG